MRQVRGYLPRGKEDAEPIIAPPRDMSDRTTLLNAEGMRTFETPGFEDTASPEALDRIEVTQFKRNYKIPTTLMTSVHQHAGPIPANFDINDGMYIN